LTAAARLAVENDETLRELTLLGIDYAQGYGVANPRRVG